MNRILMSLLVMASLPCVLYASEPERSWKSNTGKTIIKAVWDCENDPDEEFVYLLVGEKRFQIPFKNLSEADRDYVSLGRARNIGEEFGLKEVGSVTKGSRPTVSTPSGQSAGARMEKTVNGVKFAFRWCPAGTFMMGSTKLEWDKAEIAWQSYDEIQHEVRLTKGFWMLETEVTQHQWQAIMGTTIQDKAKEGTFEQDLYGIGDNYPIYYVSWYDCQDFCKKFNSLSGLQIGLPTEAQWEYACRAGTTGAHAGDLDSMAWCRTNSDSKTHPVGTKHPNAWGLYDMYGNVGEWCSDWYGDYPSGSVTDPTSASSGTDRVYRGGSLSTDARNCRSAFRGSNSPDYQIEGIGFRPVFVSFVP